MSESNSEKTFHNGLPYQWDSGETVPVPYLDYPQMLSNGLGSTQPSRDSSPIQKFINMPTSLLPNRNEIPGSQLPPGTPTFSPIIGQQNTGLKSASVVNYTPHSSPKIQNFNTSTPILQKTDGTSVGPRIVGSSSFANTSSVQNMPITIAAQLPNPTLENNKPLKGAFQINGSQPLSNLPVSSGDKSWKQNLNQPIEQRKMNSDSTPQSVIKSVPIFTQTGQQTPVIPVSGQSVMSNAPSQFNPGPQPTTSYVPSVAGQQDLQKPILNTIGQKLPTNSPRHFTNSSQPIAGHIFSNTGQLDQQKPPMPTSEQTILSNSPSQFTSSSQFNTEYTQSSGMSPVIGSSMFPNPQSQLRSTPYQNKDQSPSMNQQSQDKPAMLPVNVPPQQHNPTRISPQQSMGITPDQQRPNIPVSGMQYPRPQNPMMGPQYNAGYPDNAKDQKPAIMGPVQFPQMQNKLPASSTQMGHTSAFAPVVGQSNQQKPPLGQFSQSMGHLSTGSQGMGNPSPATQSIFGQPSANQNTRPVNPQQMIGPTYNQNARLINPQFIGQQPPNQGTLMKNQQFISQPTPNQNTRFSNPQMTSMSNKQPIGPSPTNKMTGISTMPFIGQPQVNQNTAMASSQMIGQQQVNQNIGLTNTQMIGQPPMNQNMFGQPQANQNIGMTNTQMIGPSPTNQNTGMPNTQVIGQMQPNQNTRMNSSNIIGQQNYMRSNFGSVPNLSNQKTESYQPNVPHSPPPIQNPTANQYPNTPTSNLHNKRYPQQKYQNIQAPGQSPQPTQNSVPSNAYSQQYGQPNANYNQGYQQNYQNMNQQMSNLNVTKSGFNKIWGTENYDLLQCPNVLPQEKIEPPYVSLGQDSLDAANCSPEIFRCTMTKIPETNALLQKSRLPLGVLIHPFKDLNHLPVIQCSMIVRCRACRTYINPFVFFVDTKRWKCNLCYRVNELPEEFQYDPVSKSYGDPSRRPEIKSSTIEYIAPSEYMLRPPQPAVYFFLLDISRLAIESGYLHTVCEALSSQLSSLPGDSRTQVGFLAYNSTLHFFSLGEGVSQPHEMTVLDIEDVFLPRPDNLLVNLKERMELVGDLLALLPTRYLNSFDTGSALGAALQAAFKLMCNTGGRVTVFQCSLPTLGPGALTVREDPNQRAAREAPHLNPATDFYKRLALECSGHQVAVDLFLLNSQYVDIATLSGISRFSGGCMHHFPLFKASKTLQAESLDRCFKRYLTRKIGFEAVMRIRCTRGLSVHTFHGNFFVRSTDLLSLPNVNPDAGFGMQVAIEESLSDLQSVCFQAALLYTSSKGERRIRVHTLCLPVVSSLSDILHSADQQCIVGLLSKMAVDRSLQSSLSDARDAFINVAIDILSSYKNTLNMGDTSGGLFVPNCLKLLPLYILALLKHTAFRSGQSTRLDDRVCAMCDMKSLPASQILQRVYPDLYPVHELSDEGAQVQPDGSLVPQPPRLQLTSRNIDAFGAYLLDSGQSMMILVCQSVSPAFLTDGLGVPTYGAIPDEMYELPRLETDISRRLCAFVDRLNEDKPYYASLQVIRENSPNRNMFLERLVEDRIESALSYNEFLQHVKTQVK